MTLSLNQAVIKEKLQIDVDIEKGPQGRAPKVRQEAECQAAENDCLPLA